MGDNGLANLTRTSDAMKHSTRVSLIGSLGWQILLLISVSMHSASAQTPPPDCAPASTALAFWRPVRAAANTNEVNANALAPALAACLAAPDSELRDAIAYELFTYWLRNEQLTASSQTELLSALSANLTLSGNDNSLRRSFSALILSELLRADNINAFMTTEQRSRLLELAVETLEKETDYRGLVTGIGWVHPVAHLADVLWRFALRADLTPVQSRLILRGIYSQARTQATNYVFNEGDRLSRPVAVLLARGILPSTETVVWLRQFDSPQDGESWFDAFSCAAGLMELHNAKLFIRALSDQLGYEDINDEVRAELNRLVEILTAVV